MAVRWSLMRYPFTLLVLGALLAAAGGSLAPSPGAHLPLEEGLGLAASLTGLGVLAWWTAALALALAAEWLRRRGHAAAAAVAGALTPAFMRRLAAAALGANLLTVPAGSHAVPLPEMRTAAPLAADLPGPAHQGAALGTLQLGFEREPEGETTGEAAGKDSPLPPGSTARTPRVSPEWVPLPVPCGPGLLAREPARQPDDLSAEVVVRPGDSLWSIAAERLGPFASDAEIAESWPRWHARNAPVIGPDPGLLRPGQILSAPEPP